MNQQELKNFYDMITASVDGTITAEQFEELKRMLRDNPEAAGYYMDYMSIFSHLCFSPEISEVRQGNKDINESSFDMDLWAELSHHEAQATGFKVKTIDEDSSQKESSGVVSPKSPRRVNKLPLLMALTGLAAIVFLVVIARFIPVPVQVAILEDSIDAQWKDDALSTEKNCMLFTEHGPMILDKGVVKLAFNNNVRILVESPARFEIRSLNEIALYEGRIFARIPEEAIGFTISAAHSKVVDLGTDFGVRVSPDEGLHVQVTHGRVILSAKDTEKTTKSWLVSEKQAMQASADGQSVTSEVYDDHMFVREISSENEVVWRGESLDVADIVGGGNGFGKIDSLIGLDPSTGEYTSSVAQNVRSSKNAYNLVPDSKFIDGVFVPDGSQDSGIVITSLQDTFQCPDTKGKFTHEISVYTGDIEKRHNTIRPAIFHGHKYENNAIVVIHSNAGITFDLQAIRQSLPGLNVTHFKAFGGLSEALDVEKDWPDVDFWILVDGQIRYEKKALKLDNSRISFNVELSPQDHFLTLIVTDGSRPTDAPRGYAAWNNDFFYLVDPVFAVN